MATKPAQTPVSPEPEKLPKCHELLPCPFCGSDHIILWSGYGTQADVMCEECCCERNVQVVDLFEIDERPKMDLETCRFPEASIERVNQHLISEWNTRAVEEWRDIATAPKDRTILLFDPAWMPSHPWRAYVAARWIDAKQRFESGDFHHSTATHWRPLPSPPSMEKREKK